MFYVFLQTIPKSQIPPLLNAYARSPFDDVWVYWVVLIVHLAFYFTLTLYLDFKKFSLKEKK